MRIEAIPARGGGLAFWAASLSRQLMLPGCSGSDDEDAPAVNLVAASGERHVLQRTGTYGQALRAAARFKRELDQIGPAEFCRRYRLRDSLSEERR